MLPLINYKPGLLTSFLVRRIKYQLLYLPVTCEHSGDGSIFNWGKRRATKEITRFLHFSGYFSCSQLLFFLVCVPQILLKTVFLKWINLMSHEAFTLLGFCSEDGVTAPHKKSSTCTLPECAPMLRSSLQTRGHVLDDYDCQILKALLGGTWGMLELSVWMRNSPCSP